jgi:hypothetical protein
MACTPRPKERHDEADVYSEGHVHHNRPKTFTKIDFTSLLDYVIRNRTNGPFETL